MNKLGNKVRDPQPLMTDFFENLDSPLRPVERSKTSKFNLYYQNVRGLRTKTSEFRNRVCSCDHSVIALTETSLNSSIFDSELFDSSKYTVYRTDRSELNSVHDKYGGVLIAVRSSIQSERITVPGTENVEMVLVRLQCQEYSYYICCLYIPSNSRVSIYDEYVSALQKVFNYIDLSPNDEMCVVGDFNLKDIEWIPDSSTNMNEWIDEFDASSESNVFLPTEIEVGSKANIIYLLLSNDFRQVNNIRNYQNNVLDLVFVTNPDIVDLARSEMPLSRVDEYHLPIEMVVSTDFIENIEPKQAPTGFNFKKADFSGLNNYLSLVDWSNILSDVCGVDKAVDVFYEVLLVGLNEFVPLKRMFVMNHPPWYNKRIKNLKNRMSKAHKAYRDSDEKEAKMNFFAIRKEFHDAQESAFNGYLSDTEKMLQSDPSKFWSYVNSTKKTTGYPSMMHLNGEKARTPSEICELFADFFEGVYTPDSDDSASSRAEPVDKCCDLGSITLSIDNVMSHLSGCDIKKGDGPDNISPLLLKNCSESLSAPLCKIFNLSLSTEKFPSRWKTSYVTPIYKNKSRGEVANYRGVAILPTFGKLFEAIICDILSEKLRFVISKSQHGFIKGRSTSTNLIEFVSHATKVLESKAQLDVIYTDFKKAFDRVKHSVLIRKLNEMGIHSSLLGWILSYLSGRSQYVKLSGWTSRTFNVTSGVPQGSHLGPLLFVLFMNDATKVFKSSSTYFLYADDLKICRVIRSVRDTIELQRDLNNLVVWCQNNCLCLNVDKCNIMSFTWKRSTIESVYMIQGVVLTRLHVMRDLGVLMDKKLTFSKHVEHIIAKSYSMLGFLMRICKAFKDVQTLKSIYFAHVRSYLEYASVVWHPYKDTYVDKIESIQKKFLMYALRRTVKRDANFRLPPYLDRCKSIGIESLARRRINACAFFVFDLLEERYDAIGLLSQLTINSPVVFDRSTRNRREIPLLKVERHRTDYGQYEPINNMCMLFNQFSNLYAKGMSRNSFRLKVKNMKLPIKIDGELKLT